LTAIFESIVVPPTEYTLTINASPGGYTVPTVGSYSYSEGTVVQVAAIPEAGYRLVEWQENGQPISINQSVSIMMNSDRAINAVFEEVVVPPDTYSAIISVIGSGYTIPAPGTYIHNAGDIIPVSAVPAEGWQFNHWDGDVSGNQDQIEVTIDKDTSVIAVFVEKPSHGVGHGLAIAAGIAAVIGIIAVRRKR
jgi:hypothetical protein